MKRQFYAWLVCIGCGIGLFGASSANAQDAKRVVVLEFTGPRAAAVRDHVVAALKKRKDVVLVSTKEAESARSRTGGSWGSSETYQQVGASLGVSAFVEGSVQKAGKKLKANLRVRDASTGSVTEEKSVVKTKPPQFKAIQGTFWGSFGSAIRSSSVPAGAASASTASEEPEEEAPAPSTRPGRETPPKASVSAAAEREEAAKARSDEEEEDEREKEDEVAEDEPRGRGGKSAQHPALIAWAGPRLMWRNLSYEDTGTELSTYSNAAGSPAVNAALGAAWFPGAHKRGGFLSDFGIEAEFDYSMGLKSKQGNREVKTTAYEFAGGLVYRLPLDSFEPRFRVGYVKQVFDPDVPANTPLAGVDYSSLRFGIGTGIFLVDWLSVDVNLAYLYVMDSGDISKAPFAPKLSTYGLEFGGAINTFFKEVYGIKLGVDFRRYALDFGAANPAGLGYVLPDSGSDHYLRVTLAFVFRLPGVASK